MSASLDSGRLLSLDDLRKISDEAPSVPSMKTWTLNVAAEGRYCFELNGKQRLILKVNGIEQLYVPNSYFESHGYRTVGYVLELKKGDEVVALADNAQMRRADSRDWCEMYLLHNPDAMIDPLKFVTEAFGLSEDQIKEMLK